MSENAVKTQTFDIENDTKTLELLNPCIHEGKLAYKQTIYTKKYSNLEKEFKVAKKEICIIPYESSHPELKTKLTIPIIIKRSAIDTVNVQNISAFFKTTSTITVNNPNFKISSCDGKAVLHQRDGNVVSCQVISPVLNDGNIYSITIDEDMKRISYDEALALVRQGVQVYHENPASRRPEDRFRVVLQEA